MPDFLERTAFDQSTTAKRSELPKLHIEFLKRRASGAVGTVWEARNALLERRWWPDMHRLGIDRRRLVAVSASAVFRFNLDINAPSYRGLLGRRPP